MYSRDPNSVRPIIGITPSATLNRMARRPIFDAFSAEELCRHALRCWPIPIATALMGKGSQLKAVGAVLDAAPGIRTMRWLTAD